MQLKPNQIINNRYKVLEKLDQGGMGAVWKAIDTNLGDEVALKIPLAVHDEKILRRFGEEIETMRKHAKHCPFVLNIIDVGEIDSYPFYVMQFQSGGSLRNRIKDNFDNADGRAPTWSAASFQWVPRIAEALDFLHGKECLHRDVKPENILFSGSGEGENAPFLADFGIIKDLNANHSMVTDPGAAIGSWAYMAPEVLGNASYSPRSDQYALAVSVYEVVSGEAPYAGSNLFTLRDAFDKGHRKLADLNGRLPTLASAAVDQALSQLPENRFENCTAFADAFVAGLSEPVRPLVVPETEEKEAGTRELDLGKYREDLQKRNEDTEATILAGGKKADPQESVNGGLDFGRPSGANNEAASGPPQSSYGQHQQNVAPDRSHSGLGIASFLISLGSGALMLLMIGTIVFIVVQDGGQIDEESPTVMMVGLGMILSVGIAVVGAMLGGISFLFPRKRLFAILGLVFNVTIVVFWAGLLVVGTFGG